MGFAGFGERLVDFYDGLEADNSKAYWTDHKHIYEQDVRGPMTELLAALEPGFGTGKVFRPYRDVRFAADKTPYKTHCGATVGPFYVQAGADGVLVAGGHYRMAPDQVRRYRVAVDEQRRGEDLRTRLTACEAAGLSVAGEQLKTRPRGIPEDHPRLELLRHKSLYAYLRWPGDRELLSPDLVDRVAETWRELTPLTDWLADHVGPSEQPPSLTPCDARRWAQRQGRP